MNKQLYNKMMTIGMRKEANVQKKASDEVMYKIASYIHQIKAQKPSCDPQTLKKIAKLMKNAR